MQCEARHTGGFVTEDARGTCNFCQLWSPPLMTSRAKHSCLPLWRFVYDFRLKIDRVNMINMTYAHYVGDKPSFMQLALNTP